MQFDNLVEVFRKLEGTTKRLEKTYILSKLIEKTTKEDLKKVVYLTQGKIFPHRDERELGMSSQLIVKVLCSVTGSEKEEVVRLWRKKGDLGIVANELIGRNKQRTLTSKKLSLEKIFNNLQRIVEIEGKGAVNRKTQLVSELLSNATPSEAEFIVKIVIGDMRVGIAEGVMRDAIVWAYFPKVIGIFSRCENCKEVVPAGSRCVSCGKELGTKFREEIKRKYKDVLEVKEINELRNLDRYKLILTEDEKLARKIHNSFVERVQNAFDSSNDYGLVAENLKEKGIKSLSAIKIEIGIPTNPMLAIKVGTIEEAFKALGKPLQAEFKLDGFRVIIHKKGEEFKFFTRNLENVAKQFNELKEVLKKHVKGRNYILDSELVGYDKKTGKYLPFQNISQRIKRKYDIEKKAKDVPVEINIFDVLYHDDVDMMNENQEKRRKLLEKIVRPQKQKIVLTKKKICSSEREIEDFYNEALQKGIEGLMLKNLKKSYTPGRKVGGWIKLKPSLEPLDLVIVGATYGEGKRAQFLSSFLLACKHGDNFLKCGMMGTGIKEKKEEGVSFSELTKMLKPLIISTKGRTVSTKPKIVVEVGCEEIQKSPTYEAGYALRFPRLIRLRPEKGAKQANTLDDVKHIYKEQKKIRTRKK